MITANSRYNQGTLTRMPDATGTYQLTVLRSVPPAVSAYSLYIWQVGDRPDLVAYNLLGDSSLWWAIFDINPELIYPLNIPVGAIVRIPSNPVMGQGTLLQ
jgi:hypothetical protein